MNNEIAVDTEFLASLSKVKVEEVKPLLKHWMQRCAARMLTDVLRLDSNGKIDPKIAMNNAEAWIRYAHQEGIEAGMQLERQKWEKKIRSLFEDKRVRDET